MNACNSASDSPSVVEMEVWALLQVLPFFSGPDLLSCSTAVSLPLDILDLDEATLYLETLSNYISQTHLDKANILLMNNTFNVGDICHFYTYSILYKKS